MVAGGGGVKRAPLKRRHPGSAAAAPAKRARLSREFREQVTAPGHCRVCGTRGPLDAHHVIRAQTMKRHGLPPETVYHPLAGIPACRTCHSRHHAWVARIPRALVPAASVRFLTDLGLEADLDREYPPAAEAA